jgi:hypothetical protein
VSNRRRRCVTRIRLVGGDRLSHRLLGDEVAHLGDEVVNECFEMSCSDVLCCCTRRWVVAVDEVRKADRYGSAIGDVLVGEDEGSYLLEAFGEVELVQDHGERCEPVDREGLALASIIGPKSVWTSWSASSSVQAQRATVQLRATR